MEGEDESKYPLPLLLSFQIELGKPLQDEKSVVVRSSDLV